jgi:hypothetical protein
LKEYKISQLVEEKDKALFAKIVEDPRKEIQNFKRQKTLFYSTNDQN